MIEITDSTLGLWYVELPGGNWTAMLSGDAGRAKLQCRFRWYKGRAIWDSDDAKNFYSIDNKSGASAATLIDSVRAVIAGMKAMGAGKSYELLRGTGTLDEFFDQFLALPFVHARDHQGNDIKRGGKDAPQSHARRN